jgi:hypothetical protein
VRSGMRISFGLAVMVLSLVEPVLKVVELKLTMATQFFMLAKRIFELVQLNSGWPCKI